MTVFEPDRDDVRAHLAMMQSVISRMSESSRACKTWALTLVAAMLVVITKFDMSTEAEPFGLLETWIAAVPTTIFWMLDSYYLALNRSFRDSYNSFVHRLRSRELKGDELFEINADDAGSRHFLGSMFSISTLPFYSMLGVGIFVAWLLS